MSAGNEQMPGIFAGMMALMKRDLGLAIKRPGDVLNPLFFFAMVATLFPLAVGPGEAQLQFSGPGVLWVAALLAIVLSRICIPTKMREITTAIAAMSSPT